jgi:hypothetical protein
VRKAGLVLGVFVVWLVGLIIVGGLGYPGQYFWVSFSALAVVFAVAPFWRFRDFAWYWWTIAGLAVANLVALYIMRVKVEVRDLPAKGVVQLLLVADCMMCWAAMVGVYYALHRRFPWQVSDQ